ncbi:tRNA (guanosine(37)-N1)-methyltransferase TrmD [Subdoligranulum sp. DSM 109015]|uniref:tRNA (guanine-N(1)-)-methyltransferase n=1 Tax=Gemmiger gallinarum TaxID=2779354 RepID=A0ABR9R135_9FIRM|nr:tRNA (guanosine(37)-N1)-methyltransferase TrmD [Gemmiger gallinarum]MBE5036845.1 tRNA (guanosine(37)-N1)-methyltransferase TrmD [Gemmiger gallinarum]
MRIDIVTLFPELCDSFLHASILGRAADKGLFEAHCHQIRDYTKNKQKQTDDYPYGGGCGMVLYAQPIADCIRAVQAQCAEQGRPRPHVAFLTAAGAPYNEQTARRLATYDSLILVCGHYEGIDERVIEAFGDEEISIGDYVLTGGELASLVVADSVLRLQPGVLAEEKGYQEESYWDGLIEYPQYTRPEVWEGRAVPPVLLTGDHDKIDAWRGKQSRARTRARRPDLYDRWCRTHPLTPPSWKRSERAALVRTEDQLKAAARIYSESWQQSHEGICTPDFVAKHTPQAMRQRLDADRAAGWAFYLHSTAGKPDGIVGVCHKTGEIGRLYVAPAAQEKGIGAKLLEFARKKMPEHAHPFVTVLANNRAAIALYLRMGYREGSDFTNVLQKNGKTFSGNIPEVKMFHTAPENCKTGD